MANICSNTRITGIIYRYESPSGKYYVGQTIDEKRRKVTHKSLANKGVDLPFYKAIRKYGIENFEYVVLFTIQSRSRERVKVVLNALEKYYISKYKRGENYYTMLRMVVMVLQEIKLLIKLLHTGRVNLNRK